MKLVLEVDDELMAKVMDITAAKTPEAATRESIKLLSSRDWMDEFYVLQPRPLEELRALYGDEFAESLSSTRFQRKGTHETAATR